MLSLLLATLPQIISGSRIIEPSQHSSPDGSYELSIDPTHRSGQGAARYRLTRGPELAWDAKLPYTLTEVRVLDSGVVVGYSDVCARREGACEFVVAALAPDGEVLVEERTPRTRSSTQMCGVKFPDEPLPLDLTVDAEAGRFALLVADTAFSPPVSSLWRYHLATGERLPDLTLSAGGWKDTGSMRYVGRAVTLEGENLVLLQGWSRPSPGYARGSAYRGSSFALARESDGLYVWQLDLPVDNRVGTPGLLVGTGPGAQFTLWNGEDDEHVRYRAVPDASAERGWRVEVVERTPFVPAESNPESLETPPIRHLELVQLEELPLALERDPTAVLNRPVETAHPEDDSFLVVLRSEEPNRFVHERLPRSATADELDRSFWVRPLRAYTFGRGASGELSLLAVNADGSRSLRVAHTRAFNRMGPLLLLGPDGEELARLERTLDNRWLRDIVGATFLPNGNLAVVHQPGRPSLSNAGELIVYNQRGLPLEQHQVGPTRSELLAAGRWLLFPPFGVRDSEALGLYDRESGEVFRAELPAPEDGRRLFGLSADGTRILALNVGRRTVSRWALP